MLFIKIWNYFKEKNKLNFYQSSETNSGEQGVKNLGFLQSLWKIKEKQDF